MITPSNDKNAIRDILRADSYIRSQGFKPENVITTGANADITNGGHPDKRIYIATGTPERSRSEIARNVVYDILITAPRTKAESADEVASQIIALLESCNIYKGHVLYLLDPPMELTSPGLIYIVEMTFLCQSTVYNVIKK